METFAFVVKLNLLGTFSVSAKCAAQMAKQEAAEDGEKGCIINVAYARDSCVVHTRSMKTRSTGVETNCAQGLA